MSRVLGLLSKSYYKGPEKRVGTQRSLKICIVQPYDFDEEGGVKKHALHLASRLRALGDRVDLIGPYSGSSTLPENTFGLPGVINIIANGSDNRMGLLSSPNRIRELMKWGRYDVVHVMEPSVPALPWYAAWFSGDAARIATFHAYSEREGALIRAARSLLCRQQLKLFDAGIAVSRAAQVYARRSWSRKLPIIPNGVDTSQFTPPVEINRSNRNVRFLFVGRWRDQRKGLGSLVAAFDRLSAREPSAELHVVGDGDFRHSPPTRSKRITYHGVLSETALVQMYRLCDVFVAPSTGMESFGIVLLEAMASGRPIICSDIEGYRGWVDRAGAVLVPPQEIAPLEEAMTQLIHDPDRRRQMGTANRRRSLDFDWTQLAIRIRREYLRALAAKGRVFSLRAEPDELSLPAFGSP